MSKTVKYSSFSFNETNFLPISSWKERVKSQPFHLCTGNNSSISLTRLIFLSSVFLNLLPRRQTTRDFPRGTRVCSYMHARVVYRTGGAERFATRDEGYIGAPHDRHQLDRVMLMRYACMERNILGEKQQSSRRLRLRSRTPRRRLTTITRRRTPVLSREWQVQRERWLNSLGGSVLRN